MAWYAESSGLTHEHVFCLANVGATNELMPNKNEVFSMSELLAAAQMYFVKVWHDVQLGMNDLLVACPDYCGYIDLVIYSYDPIKRPPAVMVEANMWSYNPMRFISVVCFGLDTNDWRRASMAIGEHGETPI